MSPDDHAQAAQLAAENHIDQAWDSLDNDESEADLFGPFCGCTTCVVREILHAAMPHIRAMIEGES